MSTLTCAVVLVTYKRPEDLDRALTSWQASSRLPDQVIVVDASPEAEQYRQRMAAQHPLLFGPDNSVYAVVREPSISRQRNCGIDLATGDVVILADDDYLPDPGFLVRVMEVFEADGQGVVGGVGGTDIKWSSVRFRIRRALVDVLRLYARRFGIPRDIAYPVGSAVPVELKEFPLARRRSLPGGTAGFRTHLVRRVRCDEHMLRYSYCEDFDMSFRISRSHVLVQRKDALVSHSRATEARPTASQYFFVSWVNPAYLIEKLFPEERYRRPLSRLFHLSRIKAAVDPYLLADRPKRDKTLADFDVAAEMMALLRHGSPEDLASRFSALQQLIFSEGERLTPTTFADWCRTLPSTPRSFASPGPRKGSELAPSKDESSPGSGRRVAEPVVPNFLLAGAAKSGTTSVAWYLESHPEVFMARPKEGHFLISEGKRPDFRGPGDEVANRTYMTNLSDYLAGFAKADAKAIGEASVFYLFQPQCFRRAMELNPRMRVIVILRNPVDRAYSAYCHLLRLGREHLPFDEALEAEESRAGMNWEYCWNYLGVGQYASQLDELFRTVPRSQVNVVLYDDLAESPQEVMRRLYGFLEVDDRFVPNIVRMNASGQSRNELLHKFLSLSEGRWNASLKKVIPRRIGVRTKETLRNLNLRTMRMDPAQQAVLTARMAPEVKRIEEILKCDLSVWTAEPIGSPE